MKKQIMSLPDTDIQRIGNQAFGPESPGTLLKDFQTLLNFIELGVPVSKVSHLLPIKELPAINALMSRPLAVKLKRPQQKSFPHINGLYILLRASGLTRIVHDPKEPRLVIDGKTLDCWNGLNPVEQYFALLKSWWFRGSPEIVGERAGLWQVGNYFHDGLSFFMRLLTETKAKRGVSDLYGLKYNPGLYNLALLELFGFVEIKLNPALKENWPVTDVRPTEWGQVLLKYFNGSMFTWAEGLPFQKPAADWGLGLKPYLSGWRHDLTPAEEPKLLDSAIVFKIALGPAWRKMEVPAGIPLDEFAEAILEAFNFDNEHLYEFRYRNRYGVTERRVHPGVESLDRTVAGGVAGELPLVPGEEIIFHYDFGANWRFRLSVEAVTLNKYPPRPKVIEKQGKPPRQYY